MFYDEYVYVPYNGKDDGILFEISFNSPTFMHSLDGSHNNLSRL